MSRIFLGGTHSGNPWRSELIRMLDEKKVGYFDPIVKDWNTEARIIELRERKTCEFVLYWITPEINGVYSIAEVIDDSNKRPLRTMYGFDVVSTIDSDLKLSDAMVKSLSAVGGMVVRNGGRWFRQLFEVADFLNKG